MSFSRKYLELRESAKDFPLCVATHQPICNAFTERHLSDTLDIITKVKLMRSVLYTPSPSDMKLFRKEWNLMVAAKLATGTPLTWEDVNDCTLLQDLPGEKWKPIACTDTYMVSSLGRVKSLERWHPRRKNIIPTTILGLGRSDNYLSVHICIDGKGHTEFVHRLVAITFIPNPNNLPVINHIDGNKLNNNVENLEFTTIQYNTEDALLQGLKKTKLSKEQVYEIYDRLLKGELSADIAKDYGISYKTVDEIANLTIYKYYKREKVTGAMRRQIRKENKKNGI